MNGASAFDADGAMKVSVDPQAGTVRGILQAIGFDDIGSLILVTTIPTGMTVVGGFPVGSDGSVYCVYKSNAGTKFTYNKGYKFSDLKNGAVVVSQLSAAVEPFVSKGRVTFDATGALIVKPVLP